MQSQTTQPHQQEQLIKEYEILREELAVADAQNYKITAGVFTASSVILLTGFQELEKVGVDYVKNWFCLLIFLASLAVSIPGYRMILGNRKRIWRIATYMATYLEPVLSHIKWETRLQKLRIVEKKDKEKKIEKGQSLWNRIFGSTIVTSSDVITNEILLMAFFTTIASGGVVMSLLGILQWLNLNIEIEAFQKVKCFVVDNWKASITIVATLIIAIWRVIIATRDIKSEGRTGSSQTKLEAYWKAVKEEEAVNS